MNGETFLRKKEEEKYFTPLFTGKTARGPKKGKEEASAGMGEKERKSSHKKGEGDNYYH